MEKLDKVIAALNGCTGGEGCDNCPYDGDGYCKDRLMRDALGVIKALNEDLSGAHDECHRLAKSLSIARLQRKQAWENLARITGEREVAWLSESGEPVPECPREGM